LRRHHLDALFLQRRIHCIRVHDFDREVIDTANHQVRFGARPALRHGRRVIILEQLDFEVAQSDKGCLHTWPSKV